MGLLSDTNGRKNLIGKLIKFGPTISVLSYFVGIAWMMSLAHHELSAKNYFSENQLLPGLVDTYYTTEHYTNRMYIGMFHSCSDDRLTQEFIIRELKDIGLEVYSQSYYINSKNKSGNNIYAIYRAPRTPGVESVVLNVPYKTCNSVGALALLLGTAKYFSSQVYWAKDIVFLITDNDLYGMKVWLEGYYGEHNSDVRYNAISSHAGSIQAAIVIDFEKDILSHFDLHVEGINGLLPNLDVINLVFRIANIENVPVKLKGQNYLYQHVKDYVGSLKALFKMFVTLSTGYPSGNHGFFHKYRIEAVTLKGYSNHRMSGTRKVDCKAVGKMLDGIFRSINNMLEHFHQSFFFFVLPSTHRYISIGLYMPPLACLVLPYLIWLVILWVKIFELDVDTVNTVHITTLADSQVALKVSFAFVVSYLTKTLLPHVMDYHHDYLSEDYQLFTFLTLVCVFGTLFTRLFFYSIMDDSVLLTFFILLNSAILIVILSLLNFPAAFLLAVFFTPSMILLASGNPVSRFIKILKLICNCVTCPTVMIYILCVLYSLARQDEDNVINLLRKSFFQFKTIFLYDLSNQTLGTWTNDLIFFAVLPLWFLYTSF